MNQLLINGLFFGLSITAASAIGCSSGNADSPAPAGDNAADAGSGGSSPVDGAGTATDEAGARSGDSGGGGDSRDDVSARSGDSGAGGDSRDDVSARSSDSGAAGDSRDDVSARPGDSGAADDSRDSASAGDSRDTGSAAVAAPSLGSSANFAVLGASTVTCINLSAVTGNVGVSPGTAVTGFDPSCTVDGTIHAGDMVAAQAQADLGVAYAALTAVACEHDLTGQDLGGQTLSPGVYCFDTTVGLTGALTLDGAGDANATWIFQVKTAMTTGTSSSVVMAGGGKPGNVFWQIGSSATISTKTAFQGNILAMASITLVSSSTLVGRALALDAAVTSDGNSISLP